MSTGALTDETCTYSNYTRAVASDSAGQGIGISSFKVQFWISLYSTDFVTRHSP